MVSLSPTAFLAVSVLFLALVPAQAILIRPDREDAKYLELAEKYPASVGLNLPDGEGTLIERRWILTAAHLANDIKTGKEAPKMTIGKKEYWAVKVVPHPDYKTAAGGNDIALVMLNENVLDVRPVPIYRGTGEAGKVATLVGHGYGGTLTKGPVTKDKWDRKKRAGTNKIERVIEKRSWLVTVINGPHESTDLECGSGPGDSGGPAFIEEDGKLYVAGVGSFTDDTTNDKIIGNYGDREAYTRVSAFTAWIDKVISEQ